MPIEEVIVGTVERFAHEGMTILLAEQNIVLALRLATRAVVLAGQAVVFDGARGGRGRAARDGIVPFDMPGRGRTAPISFW